MLDEHLPDEHEPILRIPTAIAHFTLVVRDVAASSVFFQRTLGWRPIAKPGNIGPPADWLAIGPEQELHLLEDRQFEPSPFEREYGRHFAISCPLAEFPALRERLAAHGAELIAPRRETPFQRFFFREPNGYVFEIVETERPGSAQ